MKSQLNTILAKFHPFVERFQRYKTFLSIILIASVLGFIVYRINSLNSITPTESAIEEQLKTSTRPRIDKEVVEKLVNLEAENIQVKTLFNQVRQNPFSE